MITKLIVNVRLHDTLKKDKINQPAYEKNWFQIKLPVAATIAVLLSTLDLPQEKVGLIIINGRQVGFDYTFSDQDRVDLFSPMAGG